MAETLSGTLEDCRLELMMSSNALSKDSLISSIELSIESGNGLSAELFRLLKLIGLSTYGAIDSDDDEVALSSPLAKFSQLLLVGIQRGLLLHLGLVEGELLAEEELLRWK